MSTRVYVKGGWVEPVCTIPTEGGVTAVVRFAEECWRRNVDLQRRLLELQTKEGPTHAEI